MVNALVSGSSGLGSSLGRGTFKNWFMLSVHMSSYGCTREVLEDTKEGQELLEVIAESNSVAS